LSCKSIVQVFSRQYNIYITCGENGRIVLMSEPGTVVIVGNNDVLYARISSLLAGEKVEVKFIDSSDHSLQKLIKQINPRLIIVDPEAPSLGGVALSLLIRRWSSAPILIMSPHDSKPDEVRILDVSEKSWLSEPLSLELVGVRLKSII
jgi:DNA-binding response OmpR family regulator